MIWRGEEEYLGLELSGKARLKESQSDEKQSHDVSEIPRQTIHRGVDWALSQAKRGVSVESWSSR
jgi:hypothetical protein